MELEPTLLQTRCELHSLGTLHPQIINCLALILLLSLLTAPHPHHALAVPELLAAVFSYLSKGDLTRVARVCRFWTPLALDVTWEAIQDFDNLMSAYHVIMQKGAVSWSLLRFT